MLQYLKLKNYKSFTDITFDFMGKNKKPKNLIILYGENGSGKTNIINVFDTLYNTFQTLNINKFVMQLLEESKNDIDFKKIQSFKKYTDISSIIQRSKTINSTSNMSIEFGFYLKEKNGSYLIEFNDNQIVHEKLEYVINKNKGVYYDIRNESRKINGSIFSSRYVNDLENMLDKYWGRHSVISILFNAKSEYSKEYFTDSISKSMYDILKYMDKISCYLVNNHGRRQGILLHPYTLLDDFAEGEIKNSKQEIDKLIKTEKIISEYFKNIYRDIIDVKYKQKTKNNYIHYKLYFQKKISGEILDIDYRQESCGTKNLLDLLPYFLTATDNGIIAIDEIDNGIHDILLSNLIKNLAINIKGQVIFTTHNTMLLDEYCFKDNIYFIEINKNGDKQIKSLTDFGYRVQPDSNVLANYLKGTFGGLPWSEMNIDFNELHKLETDDNLSNKK